MRIFDELSDTVPLRGGVFIGSFVGQGLYQRNSLISLEMVAWGGTSKRAPSLFLQVVLRSILLVFY
jgi:hypothetical protein